jgi:diacylglycerol kinase
MLSFFMGRGPAFKNAFQGLKYVLVTQRNAWIHLLITVLVIALGIIFRVDRIDWAILMIAIALVWIAEILNTSIEALVDLVVQQYHPLAKVAKDTGAAAVLFAAIIAVILGIIVFLPRILEVFQISG